MKNTYEVYNDWIELIYHAKNECVFGDPLDEDLFANCMKDAFECLGVGKDIKDTFGRVEVSLYGLIRGYSCIPAVTQSEDSVVFEASLRAAADLAGAYLHPEIYKFEENKIIYSYMLDGEFKDVVYDFETGDLGDYIELIESGFGDI